MIAFACFSYVVWIFRATANNHGNLRSPAPISSQEACYAICLSKAFVPISVVEQVLPQGNHPCQSCLRVHLRVCPSPLSGTLIVSNHDSSFLGPRPSPSGKTAQALRDR